MLSDKLQARQGFVEKRDQFEKAYQHFLADYGGERITQMGAQLNSLLMLHAELVQAPILYTLQSAAEVGFSHAQITPAPGSFREREGRHKGLDPETSRRVDAGEIPHPADTEREHEQREADDRARDIRRRMGSDNDE